jgi:hypothetical protein
MTNLKILSVAAAVAVTVPAFAVSPSYAATKVVGAGPGGGARTIGTFHGGGGPRFGGGGGWNRGGGYRGGGFGPGLAAGAIVGGAIASGAYYGGNGYYGGGGPYYGGSYAYDAPYDDGPDEVEVAPGGGGGDVNYCIQTYKSYNVQTGTYLGYDGQRHACP